LANALINLLFSCHVRGGAFGLPGLPLEIRPSFAMALDRAKENPAFS
jgi:hypothetical protein